MVDPITTTAAVFASFNHANQIIKAILDARDTRSSLEQLNALNSEIAAIQTGYISLSQQNLSMLTEIDNLKKEITCFETWSEEKKRYQLYSPWDKAFVYALKESQNGGEPPHWICAACCNKGKHSILQGRVGKKEYEEFFCECGAIIHSGHRGSHKIEYFDDKT